MSTSAWIISALAGIVCGESYLLFRFIKKMMRMDDLFYLLQDDIDVNVKYLAKLLKTATFINSPEVVEANRKMTIMAVRLDEFARRMSETTGKERELMKPANPPVSA